VCKKKQNTTYTTQRNQDKYGVSQEKFKQANPNYLKEWREDNKIRDRELNRKYVKNRYSNDIEYKLRKRLRHRLYLAIKGDIKTGSAVKDLGCTVEELKKYLESKFQPGMTWENYGEWEIDHIKPLVLFKLDNRDELLLACNYNNLQPLWKQTNRSKGAKYAI